MLKQGDFWLAADPMTPSHPEHVSGSARAVNYITEICSNQKKSTFAVLKLLDV